RRSASEDELRAALIARRQHQLDVLRSYREAGVFPINTTTPGDGHFLIDDHGTLCAVANLIAQDGHKDLILVASRTDNGLLFGDVKSGPIHDWILTSGFTQEEIARIQVPAPYVGPTPEIRPEDPINPEPSPIELANAKVRDYLIAIEAELRSNAGIDTALTRLQARPELVAQVLDGTPGPAVAAVRFAQPPPN
ncbi:MAG TPA: hypothetical protein VFU21_02285, partial [Kofleriaceae bacterium]|nr:hypothetical protein [Kofleriaceae bacterium]